MNAIISLRHFNLLALTIIVLFQSCKEKESTDQDWPQFKKDNHRSGNSNVELDVATFGEDWIYTASQLPSPAWYGPAKEDTYANSGPLPSMRDYDLAYYPIIVDDKLYYGSTSDHAIHCIDVETGKELWTYTTGGPIRVAPTFYSGKLYFGSDDGYAYCIKASNGSLVWQFSPTEKEHQKVMNNNSLISFWPIRTGVLVEQDIAYFGASLLPWKDSYFCAVDVKTGKVNKTGTYIEKYEDLTLEGAMASTGNKIVQPQGRISPMFFDKSNGVSKGQLAGTGGCFVLITPELNIVHGQTSREKSIMETLGYDSNKISDDGGKQAQFMSFKGGKEMVVKDSMSYILTDNSISAYNRNSKKVVWSKRNYQAHRIIISGNTLYVGGTDKLYAVSTKNGYPLWETSVLGTVYALAVANGALYASTGEGRIYRFSGNKIQNKLYTENIDKPADVDKVSSEKNIIEKGNMELAVGPFINAMGPDRVEIHFITKEPMISSLVWKNDFDQREIKEKTAKTDHRIIVDNIRKDFKYQYQIKSGNQKTKFFDYDNFFNYTVDRSESMASQEFSKTLKKVKDVNESSKGLAIIFGVNNMDLGLEIAEHTHLKVIIFETSTSKIQKYRNQLQSSNFYGSRISIQAAENYSNLPLTGDVANIVLINDVNNVNADEVIRLIKPKGHVIVTKSDNDIKTWTGDSKNMWQISKTSDKGFELFKKAPYETAGKWTHQYGLANNSAFGGESLWGSTSTNDFEIQWMGRPGPRFQTDRSGRKPSPLAVNGKMFVQGKERIIAVDAYNGNIYWSKEIPDLVRMNILRDCSNWVADDNHLYIAHKNNLLKVNSENGKIDQILNVNEEKASHRNDWGYISLNNDKIIGSAIPKGSSYTNYYGNGGWYDAQSGPLTHQVVSSVLFARLKTEKENLWIYERPKSYILNATITISDNQIYFLESRNPRFKLSKEGRANPEIFKDLYMVSVDAQTGKVNWEQAIDTKPGLAAYFMAGSNDQLVIVASLKGMYHIYNYSSHTGKLKWENELKWPSDNHGAHFSRPAIVNNRLIVKPGIFKLDTGELLKMEVPKAGHGCATYALSEQSAFYRGGSVTQFNFETNKFSKWERLRPDCWLSTIPAQGMVLSPEAGGGCSCGNWLETSMVFTPKSRAPLTFIYEDEKFIDTLSIEIKSKDPQNKDVYYTLDGSTPSKKSTKYASPISIDKNTNLKTIIYVENKEGEEISFIRSKDFIRFRPEPIIVEVPILVDGNWQFILDLKANSGNIHYTVDGSTPTVNSTKYNTPVTFAKNTIIKAKTFWDEVHGNFESEEASFEMLIPNLKESVQAEVKPGILRNYYKGSGKKEGIPDLDKLIPVNNTISKDISVAPFKNETMFGLQFKGYINIPDDGVYTISGQSGGGLCNVYLHGSVALESKGGEEVNSILYLKKGMHPIKVDYLIANGNAYYNLELEGQHMKKQPISADLLFN